MGQGNGSGTMMVMAIVKGVIAVMLVGSGCYCLVTGVEMHGAMLALIVAVVGAYFGFSARIYETTAREIKARNERWKKGGGI